MLNVISFRHNSDMNLSIWNIIPIYYIILYTNLSYLINALRNFNQSLF